MDKQLNHKGLPWLNTFLLISIFLTLSLVLVLAYKGWNEDRALHYSDQGGHSEIIADITINLSGIPHQEHCLTCHPQGKTVKVSGRNLASQNDHPVISPHSVDVLGCTACHLGEGMARDLVISHGRLGNEARKVLAGQDLQASCYRCHELKPLAGAEKAWEGSHLFSANACDTCHNVDGLAGGRYGPDLSEVGSFLGLQQIQKAIEDPRSDPENSIMPKFSLSPDQIKAITYFLKSRTKESLHETAMIKRVRMREQGLIRERGAEKVAEVGKPILQEKKCLACHKFEKEDGQIAPDLTYTAYMRQEDYIRTFLHNPVKEIPGAIMPWISMTQQEEERVVRTLQQKGKENHLHQMKPKHLYMGLCQRCHAAQGDGFGTIQPNLANFPRAFWKNGEFFRRIPDERILKSIEKGIPGTSMPPYGGLLGRESIHSLIDLVFQEFIRVKRNDKRSDLTLPSKPTGILAREKMDKEFTRHCSSCHGVAGNGRGPEYLKYLPRPRDLTNQPYFKSIADEWIALTISYGVPGTGMGPFGDKISTESLWSLVKKMRELSGTNGKSTESN